MNSVWNRFLKKSYRKDPLSSFILTVGAVDAVIGGVNLQWSLFLLGLGAVGVAIALRWWKTQGAGIDFSDGQPIHYLPAQSSRPAMPALDSSRKRRRS